MRVITVIAMLVCSVTASAQQYSQPYTPYGSAQPQVKTYAPPGPDAYAPSNTYPVPNKPQRFEPDNIVGKDIYYDEQGRASFSQGDADKAQFSFEKALEVNPFDSAALNNLAVVKAEQGDYYAAIDLLQRASKLAPNNPEVSANLARLRSWVQTYAMTPQEPHGVLPDPNHASSKTASRDLPPPPPPLWGQRVVRY